MAGDRTLTEQMICYQTRAIRKNDWISELEIKVVKRKISQEVAEDINVQGGENTTARGSVDDDGIQREEVELDFRNENAGDMDIVELTRGKKTEG